MQRYRELTDRQRAELYEEFIQSPNATSTEDTTDERKARAFFQAAKRHISTSATHMFAHTFDDMTNIPQVNAEPVYANAYTAPSQPQVIHHHHNSGIPWWALCFMGRGNTTNTYYNTPPARDGRREGNNSGNATPANFAAFAVAVVIAGAVVAPAAIGAFYLLSELGQNLERLYYNEGYIQAGLGMANITLSLCLSAVLTNAVLSTAITALTVSAGFANPVSWAFFIMGCVTLFVAACIHWAVQEGIYKANTSFNKDELNPEDPHRFTVTHEQVTHLKKKDRALKGLDREKMQNVITAIHHEMTHQPTTMTRYFRYSPFFRSAETAAQLSAIRTLRNYGTVDYTATAENEAGNDIALTFNSRSLRK